MPSITYADANKLADYSSQSADFKPVKWSLALMNADVQEDFWGNFETSSEMSLVHAKADAQKMAGQKINFRVGERFYGTGVRGENLLTGAERHRVGTFSLSVAFLRNRFETNLNTAFFNQLESEIEEGIPAKLGGWLGWKKSEEDFFRFKHFVSARHTWYLGGAGLNGIRSADTLTTDAITAYTTAISRSGAKPLKLSIDGDTKNRIAKYAIVACKDALDPLKASNDYKLLLRDAGERGEGSPLFKGGYYDLDGQTIIEYRPEDHSGYGPISFPWQPRAQLGTAIAAGTTAVSVTGGGSAANGALTDVQWFAYFPGAAYEFSDQTVAADGATRYFLIYNEQESSPGAGDAGKFGMYSYVASTGFTNTANAITITQRLGSDASGARVTTLGGVTWDTGVWSTRHTAAHPSGSPIIPCNSYGVPIACSAIVGASALYRAYGGVDSLARMFGANGSNGLMKVGPSVFSCVESHNGGFIHQRYVGTVRGSGFFTRPDGLTKNVGLLWHACPTAGIDFPTVT